MKGRKWVFAVFLMIVCTAKGDFSGSAAAMALATPTATGTPLATIVPTPSPSATPINTTTPTTTPIASTPTPTSSFTPTPTALPSPPPPTPTKIPTASPTTQPTISPTPASSTPTPISTVKPTATVSPTPNPTQSPTPTPVPPTGTPTPSPNSPPTMLPVPTAPATYSPMVRLANAIIGTNVQPITLCSAPNSSGSIVASVSYGSVSSYYNIPAGSYTLFVVEGGDCGATQLSTLSLVVSGGNYFTISAVGNNTGSLMYYEDAYTISKNGFNSWVRLINQIPYDNMLAAIWLNGVEFISGVQYSAASNYNPIYGATYNLGLTYNGTAVFNITDGAINGGYWYSVFAVGDGSMAQPYSLILVQDSTGIVNVTPPPSSIPWWVWVCVAVGVLILIIAILASALIVWWMYDRKRRARYEIL